MSEAPSEPDKPIPVSANWLKDVATPEEEKVQKFWKAHELREQVLTNHFDKPLNPEYLLNLKQRLEEVAHKENWLDGGDIDNYFVLFDPENDPSGYYYFRPTITQWSGDRPDTMEVRIWRVHASDAREVTPNSQESIFVHDYPQIGANDIGDIWLGQPGKNDLPRVNAGELSKIVTPEETEAALKGEEIPLNMERRKNIDMDNEYIELCASNGISIEDLQSLAGMEFPDPTQTDRKIVGLFLNTRIAVGTRGLRNNYNDVFALNIIEKALEKNVRMSHTQMNKLDLEILSHVRGESIKDKIPCPPDLPEDQVLRVVSYGILDIAQADGTERGIPHIDKLGYGFSKGWELGKYEEKTKAVLKDLAPEIIKHCYKMDYGKERLDNTQPDYRIDYEFLKEKGALKKLKNKISKSWASH